MTGFTTILINTTSIALLIFSIVYAWHQRAQNAAPQLMVTAIFMFVWAAASFAELLAVKLDCMIAWRNIAQIGVFFIPPACLMFAMAYTGAPAKTRRRLGVLGYGIQAISVALIFSDSWLHLVRVSISVAPLGNFSVLVIKNTLLAQFMVSINFVFLAASLLLLIIFAVRTSHAMRKQVILTATSIGVAGIFAFLKLVPGEGFVPGIPISGVFGIACLAMLLGILRYSFLKVLPVARDEVMSMISEGIIFASPKGEILDVNATALRFFSRGMPEPISYGAKGLSMIGRLLPQRFPGWHEALVSCRAGKLDLSRTVGSQVYYYQCSISPLDSKARRARGTISVLWDVTEQVVQNKLLKERAEHDGLLGILNRQTFFERAEAELAQSKGENSLVFFDIDDFKIVNDTFGHIAGDHALRAVCACVQRVIGPNILFGRTGGEEFAILFRNQSLEPARLVAERVRAEIERERIRHQGQAFGVTISIGIASAADVAMQQLYQRADRMLYQAKASGKNRCAV